LIPDLHSVISLIWRRSTQNISILLTQVSFPKIYGDGRLAGCVFSSKLRSHGFAVTSPISSHLSNLPSFHAICNSQQIRAFEARLPTSDLFKIHSLVMATDNLTSDHLEARVSTSEVCSPFPTRCFIFTMKAFPCFLAFITSFIWILFGPAAPTTTVAASIFWMLPIIVSTSFAFSFLLYRGLEAACYDSPSSEKTTLHQAIFDVVRSVACIGTLYLVIWYFEWKVICTVVARLGPYDPHSEESGSRPKDWAAAAFYIIFTSFIGIIASAGCWITAWNDIDKLREARKMDSRWA
jgi:hypothetical protein